MSMPVKYYFWSYPYPGASQEYAELEGGVSVLPLPFSLSPTLCLFGLVRFPHGLPIQVRALFSGARAIVSYR